jgi:hypothetical protein
MTVSWRRSASSGGFGSGDPRQPASSQAPQLIPVIRSTTVLPRSRLWWQIEIHVGGRYSVCVDGGFDGQALRRVLDVLEQQ